MVLSLTDYTLLPISRQQKPRLYLAPFLRYYQFYSIPVYHVCFPIQADKFYVSQDMETGTDSNR